MWRPSYYTLSPLSCSFSSPDQSPVHPLPNSIPERKMAAIGGRRIVASEKIFDTGTPEGKAQLTEEAVVAVNSNKKLREGLTVSSLSSLIKGYQSHVRRYDTSLLTTLQAGEEGQESVTLAASAANDMLERLKTFSSSAQVVSLRMPSHQPSCPATRK